MKTILKIQIDCEEKTCGECEQLDDLECSIWGGLVLWKYQECLIDKIHRLRHPRCLAAQEEANE